MADWRNAIRWLDDLVGAAGFLAAIATAAVLWQAPARGHSFYDPLCCDEHDCRPAEPGTVIPWAKTDGRLGWMVDDPRLDGGPVFVDESTVFGGWNGFPVLRETPPADPDPYHTCVMYGQLRCLYVRDPRF